MEKLEKIIGLEKQLRLRKKYLLIRDLCYLLLSLLPNKTSRNETNAYTSLIKELSEEEKGLLNLLTHLMTLLHSDQRLYEKGYYHSEKEDVYLALKLMGSSLNPVGFMSSGMKSNYLHLSSYFGNRIFKANEASTVLGLKKTETWRVLKKLVKSGLYYEHKRHGSQGYLYQKIKEEP